MPIANNTTHDNLERQVRSIADTISNGITVTEENREDYPDLEIGDSVPALDYFHNALDINYIINANGSYKAVKILVAFGGPNIWVNTDTMAVEGYWWGDRAIISFHDEMGIDDWFEELYSSTIPA